MSISIFISENVQQRPEKGFPWNAEEDMTYKQVSA